MNINIRTVQRALARTHTPHADDRNRLADYAIEYARKEIGAKRTTETCALLFEFLESKRNT